MGPNDREKPHEPWKEVSTKPSAYELRKRGVRGCIVSPQKLHSGPDPGTRKCDLCGNRVFADVKMRSLGWALTQ